MLPRSSPGWILEISSARDFQASESRSMKGRGPAGQAAGAPPAGHSCPLLLARGASYRMSSCESPTPPGLQRTFAIPFLSPPSSAPVPMSSSPRGKSSRGQITAGGSSFPSLLPLPCAPGRHGATLTPTLWFPTEQESCVSSTEVLAVNRLSHPSPARPPSQPPIMVLPCPGDRSASGTRQTPVHV